MEIYGAQTVNVKIDNAVFGAANNIPLKVFKDPTRPTDPINVTVDFSATTTGSTPFTTLVLDRFSATQGTVSATGPGLFTSQPQVLFPSDVTHLTVKSGRTGSLITTVFVSNTSAAAVVLDPGQAAVNVNLTTGPLTILQGIAAAAQVTISPAGNMQSIAGAITILANDPTRPRLPVQLNDISDSTGRTATFSSAGGTTMLSGLAPGAIGFSGAMADVTIVGGSGSNSLGETDGTNTWDLNSTNIGKLNSIFSYSRFANLHGGSGSDDFTFMLGGSVTGDVDAGDGIDTAHYSPGVLTGSETINLAAGILPKVSGHALNFEAVETQAALAVINPGQQSSQKGTTITPLTIHTTGGSGVKSFSATGLPPGLSIDSQTGIISGTISDSASTTADYISTVSVHDNTGTPTTQFHWTVFPPIVNTVTLPIPSGGTMTLTSDLGTALSASIVSDAGVGLPGGIQFPFGYLNFEITGSAAFPLMPGAAVTLTLSGPSFSQTDQYYKYGPTPANPTAHWYDFLFNQQTDADSASGTGMQIVGGNLVLHLVDGGRGDDDLTQNSDIRDLGGPAFVSTTTSTVTALTSDHPAGATYGQLLHFTATVSAAAGTPAGSVQFKIDGQNIGLPHPLAGGAASLDISALSAVDHAIVALYDDDNGAFADSEGDFTQHVDRALLTITAADKTKAYGAALPALTADYSGFISGESPANLSTLPTLGTTATATSHVGPYSIAPSGAAALNYTISYVPGTLNVTPVSLAIEADDKTKAYGAALPILSASYTGFVNSDTATSLTTQPILSTAATAASHVANYTITAAGAVDADYTITYVPGSLSVTPVSLTVTAENKSKVYGAALPALTAGYLGFVNDDTAANLATKPTLNTTAAATSHVASYPITVSGAVDNDYTISYVAGSLSVTPVGLTITAVNKSKVYGAALPTLTASYAGFVNGDASSNLTTQPILSTIATAASPVGTYPITASGAVDPDYSISYVPGSTSVTPAPLTIKADDKSKTAGSANPPLTFTPTGFVNGDTASSLTTQPILTTTATTSSPAGDLPNHRQRRRKLELRD